MTFKALMTATIIGTVLLAGTAQATSYRVNVNGQDVRFGVSGDTVTVITDGPAVSDVTVRTETLTHGSTAFNPRQLTYQGQTEIISPVTIENSRDFVVNGDAIIKAPVYINGSGDFKVNGNAVALAPMTINASGDIEISGDLILRNQLLINGSGDLDVDGTIFVINGKGSIEENASGEVEGRIVYVDEQFVSSSGPAAVTTTVVPGSTVTTTTTTREVITNGGSQVIDTTVKKTGKAIGYKGGSDGRGTTTFVNPDGTTRQIKVNDVDEKGNVDTTFSTPAGDYRIKVDGLTGYE